MPRVILGGEDPWARKRESTQANYAAISNPSTVFHRLDDRRSTEYVRALSELDLGPGVNLAEVVQSIIEKIRAELPDIELSRLPSGIVAKCYLGAPYEVHTLDLSGNIIRHYKTFEPLPEHLEVARSLALHPKYAFIEVYADALRAVMKSGEVAVVKR
ncbi:hypothetical protein [Alicyclobacillus mali (ex Roth et al. 2021)]|uniref:hypothetical protein n=1 Tax=Alicyclobacillus mali (ex Roth et al. 2021) TaxID=1123961 RepID=UPI001A8FFD27|nr:hypothetical protein [Alicyclobacillus mali (ex Roth et al. 2021)]